MSIEHAILGIISWYPASGYEMKVEFELGGVGLAWGMSFGSIYPKLEKLEREGFIKVQEQITEGRPKKIYELTAKGWQELSEWLGKTPAYPLPLKDELLLKMGFWGTARSEDRATLVQHLQERKTRSLDLLNFMEKWSKNGVSMIDEYGMLALKYFKSRLEAELDWLDMAIAQLKGPPQPPIQDPNDLIPKQRERRARAFAAQQETTDEE